MTLFHSHVNSCDLKVIVQYRIVQTLRKPLDLAIGFEPTKLCVQWKSDALDRSAICQAKIRNVYAKNVQSQTRGGVESNQTNFELIFIEFFEYFLPFESIELQIFESDRTNFEQISI